MPEPASDRGGPTQDVHHRRCPRHGSWPPHRAAPVGARSGRRAGVRARRGPRARRLRPGRGAHRLDRRGPAASRSTRATPTSSRPGWATVSRSWSRPPWSRRSALLTVSTDFRSVYLRTLVDTASSWGSRRRRVRFDPHRCRRARRDRRGGARPGFRRPRSSTPTAPPGSCWASIATSCAAAPSCRRPASACRSRARRSPSAGPAPTRCAPAARSARASWASRAPTAACAGCACPRRPSAARC